MEDQPSPEQINVVLCDPRGRRTMVLQLLLCRAGHPDWTIEQLQRLLATVDSVAEVLRVDPEKMLLHIGELQGDRET